MNSPVSLALKNSTRNLRRSILTIFSIATSLFILNYMGNVKLFLITLCAAVTFMLMLVSGNTVAMVVRERVKDIGILKTLGFSPGTVLGLLVFESVMISLVGAVIGLIGAGLCCLWFASGPIIFADLNLLYLPPSVIGIGLVLAVLIAVVGTLIPAWPAVRRPIVDCLRVVD